MKAIAIGTAILLASTAAYLHQYRSLIVTLENFDQLDEHSLALTFSSPVADISAIALADVPATLGAQLKSEEPLELDIRDEKTVVIGLSENHVDTEYSIIITAKSSWCDSSYAFLLDCAGDHVIEIVRQPASWLRRLFSFDRPDGYSILGRRTIEVRFGDIQSYQASVFPDDAALPTVSVNGSTAFASQFSDAAIDRSAELIREIWSEPLRAGPTNHSYSDFIKQPLQKKIRDLRNGGFSVSCQGVQDLFLHAAKISGLNVRAVEAFNYGPQFKDLISYGHSTAEVWSERLDKFVMIDPWMGLTINNRDGVPLSSQEIAETRSADLEVTPLLPELRRFIILPNGEVSLDVVRPAKTRLTRSSKGAFGSGPGYLTYYRKLAYRDVLINGR